MVFFLFFYGGTGVGTQDLVLASQVLYLPRHIPAPENGLLEPPSQVAPEVGLN